MKLFKPPWVSHNNQPIFSIDIHPDGSRFATGGQGEGGSSGKVIVWNMTPVCNTDDEKNSGVPKVLCVMENHLACVNCVRWSCNGRYLASGGDDRLIMIWQFAGYGAAGVFGSSAQLKTSTGERWRCSHTLKGHTGDVLDLAWSPANQWLASCSIDNTIVIWNVEKFPEITTVLKGHTSLVKGVTWDPIGSYVASQSDDKTVKIWKTLDWKLETTITKPFEECTATTHVLRLSWSPDGGYLVSAHAMNNSGPTAQIIERADWKTEMDFVGHRKAITCTRFNGCVFSKPTDDQSASLPYTCCAVGSRDRAVSIWLTSLRRPLVVIHDLFENSVMDISWSFNGYFMLCCSWDGTVAYVEFTPDEIGQTLSPEEKNKLHKDTYGKSSSLVSQPLVIENPAMLAIQEKKNDTNLTNGVETSPSKPVVYPTKQIETRTATGRRRIIPVFVAPQEALGGIPRPFGSSSNFGKISSTLMKSAEKLKHDSPSKNEVSPVKSIVSNHSTAAMKDKKSPSKTNSSVVENNRSPVTSEKTSIQPSNKTSPQTDDPAQLKKAVLDIRLCEPTKPTSIENKTTEDNVEKVGQKNPPKDTVRPTSVDTSVETETGPPVLPRRPGRPPLGLKRKQGDTSTSPNKKKHKQMRKDHPKSHVTPEAIVGQSGTADKDSVSSSHKSAVTRIHLVNNVLPVPKLARKISVQCQHNHNMSLVVENELNSENRIISGALHKISCMSDKQDIWFSVLSSPIKTVQSSLAVVGVSCSDHTIHVFSMSSGRRLLPPLCFGSSDSSVAKLHCRGYLVMAIDAKCNVSVWDTKSSKVMVNNQSFLHLIPDSFHTQVGDPVSPLRQCSMTDQGIPLITLLERKSYTYSVDLATWILVRSPNGAIEQFSENVNVATSCDPGASPHEQQIFSVLNKRVHNSTGAHASRSFHAPPATQRHATLSLLEQKVASSFLLQSSSEYRKWLLAYVRYLVQENLELRLREVCDNLIGSPNPRHTANRLSSWKPHILGIPKRTLLRENILPLIGSNLSFQRLYTEYQDQLDAIQSQQRPAWQTNVT